MKAHVTKSTPGIKMPQYKQQKISAPPKAKVQHVKLAHVPKPSVKSTPALKLPTISQHREKLADLGSTAPPKKGKST